MKAIALIAAITLTAMPAMAQPFYGYQPQQPAYAPPAVPMPYSQVRPWLPPSVPPGTGAGQIPMPSPILPPTFRYQP
jgi:hypothetical protein